MFEIPEGPACKFAGDFYLPLAADFADASIKTDLRLYYTAGPKRRRISRWVGQAQVQPNGLFGPAICCLEFGHVEIVLLWRVHQPSTGRYEVLEVEEATVDYRNLIPRRGVHVASRPKR